MSEDEDEALNRLYGVEEAEFIRPSDADPPRPPDKCAECGSSDIAPIAKLLKFALLAALIMGIGYASNATMGAFLAVIAMAIYLLIAPGWSCHQCGARW